MRKTAFATFDDAKEMMYEIMDAARNFQPWPMHPEGDFHESAIGGVWLLEFWLSGDWKHDHWAFDSQVEELYPFLLYKGESVTEDNGSDYYTAVHQFAFAGKDVDLNAMARLFANKEGKKAMKSSMKKCSGSDKYRGYTIEQTWNFDDPYDYTCCCKVYDDLGNEIASKKLYNDFDGMRSWNWGKSVVDEIKGEVDWDAIDFDDENWYEVYRNASRRMTKKAGSYDTVLVNSPDDEAFDYLYGNSAFTWEGMTSDPANLNAIYDAFVEEGFAPKDGLRFYVISGAAMNSRYGLVGSNAYPDDLTILSIPLDDFGSDAGGHLYMWKFEVGARWFDDIVDNNARHNAKKSSRKAMRKCAQGYPSPPDDYRAVQIENDISHGGTLITRIPDVEAPYFYGDSVVGGTVRKIDAWIGDMNVCWFTALYVDSDGGVRVAVFDEDKHETELYGAEHVWELLGPDDDPTNMAEIDDVERIADAAAEISADYGYDDVAESYYEDYDRLWEGEFDPYIGDSSAIVKRAELMGCKRALRFLEENYYPNTNIYLTVGLRYRNPNIKDVLISYEEAVGIIHDYFVDMQCKDGDIFIAALSEGDMW